MAKGDAAAASAHKLKPICEIGAKLGVPPESLIPYGHTKAKIALPFIESLAARPDGKLILVTAITPTPAGEGKTTTTIGLSDGLNLALSGTSKHAVAALREPSLGPCFGMKGGATGGGQAQVAPGQDINLHFTGDFHAVTAAHNLLAAMIDNHVYWGNALNIDTRRISWRRALDMNDRSLREIVSSLGGAGNGFPREDGFDITVASEVMAVLCLASDRTDLTARLGRIVVGQTCDKKPITAHDLKAKGAMAVLLKDAMSPNLVQTLGGTPALIHGGPFANIAHGCNSLIATRAGLKLADYVVTEAGFGADLGAEKFFDIKCRLGGLTPAAVVIVATVRALKMHGGAARDALGLENVAQVRAGSVNLIRHIQNIRKFGLNPIVAINRFHTDTEAEIAAVNQAAQSADTQAFECTHFAHGGAGIVELARAVIEAAGKPAHFKPLYPDSLPLRDKVRTIAREIYRADDIAFDKDVERRFAELEAAGFGHLPICMAKTQYSFSTDPSRLGAPDGHSVTIAKLRLSAGAGFIVALAGDIMTMPGLPRTPAAEAIHLSNSGEILGLM